MTELFQLVALGILTVIFAYVIVRSISFAYFRTKTEHLRRVIKDMKEGED